ncbi:alpha-amylase/4-alpha-glucanotransferase domain-containing protein [Treponema sp.]|uniref:alpha-amylase/4-alpha-glucanotransferase domain-containing protein n=1 Tax=Treponema sp. TaxID=166 RepID=UPI003F0E1ED1
MENKFCLVLNADLESSDESALLEKNYQNIFKPLLSFLYSHKDFFISVGFSGPQLSHYAKKHPESMELLKELAGRRQVEIIGGGYYSPVFPLLLPMDRSGQIEKLSSLLRSSIGKRPCGMQLFGSIWDPCLVSSFQSCGLDYVFLDSSLIPEKHLKCCPLIASEQGRSIKIFPSFKNLVPSENESGENWINRIQDFARQLWPDNSCFAANQFFDPILSVCFSFSQFGAFMKSGCFEFIMENSSDVVLTTPNSYLKKADCFLQAYIPAGMDSDIAKWSLVPFEPSENKTCFPLTIHDYLNIYSQNRRLYERMVYISMLVSQCKGGDKVRKTNSSELLWRAQDGTNYLSPLFGSPSPAEKRQKAFRLLNEAEHLLREAAKVFRESLTSFDYNGDGIFEYVCQMEKYNAVVSRRGGQLSELNFIKSGANYAASLSKISAFDGGEDLYARGFFADHLLEKSAFENYLAEKEAGACIFSNSQFSEKKLDPKRKEIQLEAAGVFSSMELPVRIRKNFIFSSSGIMVQYILKNESPLELDGVFVVELNFAQTRFEKKFELGTQYSAEAIVNEEKCPLSDSFFAESGVSIVQVKDSADKRIFVIEPNEDSGVSCSMISFKRPVDGCEQKISSSTYKVALCWNISLSAGMEKEKTINLTVMPMKK